ncbi:MAG: class I tRNA ligase family protein, partial [Proteobacteria bacterium]|nr:class I tRNA ligase family protein [Pseudomonadota bacterium]
QGDHARAAASTRHTLLFVLEATLRLLHPLIPFVTEEIWQQVAPKLGIAGPSISLRPYPQADEFAGDFASAEVDVEWLKAAVTGLRRIRSELNVAPSRQVSLLLQGGDASDRMRVARFGAQLQFLARIESIVWLDAGVAAPAAATALVGELSLRIPLAGLIDLDAERARLAKEIARVEGEIRKSEAKLANFADKAPPAVVEQERTRLTDWSGKQQALRRQLELLGSGNA